MQSEIEFPQRDLFDWYTLDGVSLGRGSFGEIESALDDRAALLELRSYYTGTPLPQEITEIEYELLEDTTLPVLFQEALDPPIATFENVPPSNGPCDCENTIVFKNKNNIKIICFI